MVHLHMRPINSRMLARHTGRVAVHILFFYLDDKKSTMPLCIGVHMNSASDFSCKNWILLVIFSYIFWQIPMLQGWQMAMLLDKQMSIFPVWQMVTYPKWQICKSYPIVCTWLHTSHAKQPFALKACTNPTLRIFPRIKGEDLSSHFAYGCSI